MAVIIENGKISEINITSAEKEDGAYLSMAEDIIPSILEAQSADVDTISGATFSSTGIKEAVAQALEEAANQCPGNIRNFLLTGITATSTTGHQL